MLKKTGYAYINAQGVTLKTSAEQNVEFCNMAKNAAASGKMVILDGVKMDSYIVNSVPVEVEYNATNTYLTFIARASATSLNVYMITINNLPNVVSYAKKTITLS